MKKYQNPGCFTVMLGAILLICPPLASAQEVRSTCSAIPRECMITAAKSYLDGIVHADGSRVLLAPNVQATIAGRLVDGEAALRDNLNREPPMIGHANTRYFVDESAGTVVAFTLLRVTANRGTNKPATVHMAERYKVKGGLLTEIEAIFYMESGTSDGSSGWADVPSSNGRLVEQRGRDHSRATPESPSISK